MLDACVDAGYFVAQSDEETKQIPEASRSSNGQTVEFCELEWDFKEFVSSVGFPAVSYAAWKEYYERANGVLVVASPQVQSNAEIIFAGIRIHDINEIFVGTTRTHTPCRAEGFSRSAATDSQVVNGD